MEEVDRADGGIQGQGWEGSAVRISFAEQSAEMGWTQDEMVFPVLRATWWKIWAMAFE